MSDLRSLRQAEQSLETLSEQLRDGTTNSLMAELTLKTAIDTINKFRKGASSLACRHNLT